jgi:cell division protein FtsN
MPVNRNTATRRRRRSAFHGGSFAAGLILGTVLTLTGAFLPTILEDEPAASGGADAPPASAKAAPKFEFFETLPKNRVEVDTKPYQAATPAQRRPAEPVEYLLQAGSFTNHDDADRMRQSVTDLGLPASTVAAQLADGVQRHRVIVGPFAAEADVLKAKSQLRERNIDALLLARKPAAG